MTKLTLQDFCDAANELKCSVAAIKAVATVESGGRSGFDDKGRLLLRFEGHVFRKYTGGKYDKSHPHLSYSYKNRFGKSHGYTAFNEAFALDKIAALLATSFGMFQPMGFNHDEMDYDSVEEMVSDFQTGEKAQLKAFVKLIKKWGLADELRRATLRDFQVFARMYNGADYAVNRYDEKMHDYYLSNLKKNLKCPSEITPDNIGEVIDNIKTETVQNAASSSSNTQFQPEELTGHNDLNEKQVNAVVESSQPPVTETATAPAKEGSTASATKITLLGFTLPAFVGVFIQAITDLISKGYISAAQIGEFVLNYIKENQKYVFWCILGIILIMIIKKLCKQISFWITQVSKAIPWLNSVEVKPNQGESN